jgi:hypothetical protein
MPDWLTWVEHFIQTVGFPIFVACFLLIVERQQNKQMLEAIEGLKAAIEALVSRLDQS